MVLAAIAIAALGAAGCERNHAVPYLVPTGLRPRPTTGTGAIAGRVLYDPEQTPDLADPPYPPTIVTLEESGTIVAADTLPRSSRAFAFAALPPGTYTVVATARLFRRSSLPPVHVVADQVDVGDLIAPIDLNQLTTVSLYVSGDFNDFFDFADSCSMQQLRLGLWYGPNFDPVPAEGGDIPPDTALTLTTGVHRIRFFAISGLPTQYYGAATTDIVDVPLSQEPLLPTNDPESTLQIRIPGDGRYRFFVDERRLTLSIERLPPSSPAARRILP
jgi:hypothetical protein